ncbi:MAG: DNA-directed RNA polymerase subunit alpha [Deltaproteobacteria bacterium]|nr:DNA-directed RNA polymerase subunit alpha [Deltaproteobacteria bacterium]MBI4223813.1 DNA-directed RNA polymerase subunit alpha [Deltaproteobacteria bacterium]
MIQRNWVHLIRPKALEFAGKELTPGYGKFVASPLERGFGITIGNALRRILLSSLQGAAITKIKLEGVQHEFSTLPGVKEDVTDILLNLKGVKLRLLSGSKAALQLDVKGPKEVRAGDFQCPAEVEILNPSSTVATLNKDGKLKGTFHVTMGRGYVPAEEGKASGDAIGMIPMDAVYSPVTRVNYNVTHARVGQRTDYDKLTMELWTDGSVKPEDALAFAAKILKEQLQIFINFDEAGLPEIVEEEEGGEEGPGLNPNLYRRVDELELSVRSANCLANANIKFLGELVQKTEAEMLKTKNFGRKSLNEIKETLTELGLTLGMNAEGFSVEDAEKYRPKDVE